MSAVYHGMLLAICVLFIPGVLNLIPLASLAAILIVIGYKLSSVQVFKQIYKDGLEHFIPFCVTILAILFTDLLTGIGIGLGVGVFALLRTSYKIAFKVEYDKNREVHIINFAQIVSFLSKGGFIVEIAKIPADSKLVINGLYCEDISKDILTVVKDFRDATAKEKNIKMKIMGLDKYGIPDMDEVFAERNIELMEKMVEEQMKSEKKD